MQRVWRLAALAAALCGAALGSGCAAVAVGAVAGGAVVAADRRSVGIQVEDRAIENRINRALADRFERGSINVSVNSYDRKVLLTGEVRTDEARAEVERIAASAENVRAVVNEVQVGLLSTVASRANDTAVSAAVRGMLLNERNVPSGTIKVVTERGEVYLMGRVTEPEGELAARVASRTTGVRRVTKVFDYLTEEQAAALRETRAAAPAAPGSQRP